MPSEMSLNELAESAAQHAKNVLLDQPGASLIPTFLIQGRDRTTIVGAPFDGELEKDIVANAIRFTLKHERADSYSFMSEAWVTTQLRGEPYIQPSKSDKRREIVVIIAVDRAGGGRMQTYAIERNDQGVVIELKAEPGFDGLQGGRFADLFHG
jgi:hypothetical protein